MANPPNAIIFTQPMDPKDVVEYTLTIPQGSGQPLETGETIASYTLALTAEAAAAGLTIVTTGGYTTTLVGQVLTFWLSVSVGQQAAAVFSVDGMACGIEFTFNTNSSPARTKQRTLVVKVAQQ